jgi:hypothetical protein
MLRAIIVHVKELPGFAGFGDILPSTSAKRSNIRLSTAHSGFDP